MGHGLRVNMRNKWRVIAASVAGTSHLRAGLPCQDAHGFSFLPEAHLAVAVADGAGSAARGELGARWAVESAIAALASVNLCTQSESRVLEVTHCALEAARDRLLREAETQQIDLRSLACTLLLVLAGPHFVAAAQVGDGACVVQLPDRQLVPLTRPPQTEYVNETLFLTSESALEAVQYSFCAIGPLHIAVTTDGLQRLALKLPEGEPFAPFFLPLFRFAASVEGKEAEQLEAFLRSPRVVERTDDDLTLVIATNLAMPLPGSV